MLIGTAYTLFPNPRYLTYYDPDYADGVGIFATAEEHREALHFRSADDAYKFWLQRSTARPCDEDGKPNQPLTYFSIAIVEV